MTYVIGPTMSAETLAARERLGVKGIGWRHVRVLRDVQQRRAATGDVFMLTWDVDKLAGREDILESIRNSTNGNAKVVRECDIA